LTFFISFFISNHYQSFPAIGRNFSSEIEFKTPEITTDDPNFLYYDLTNFDLAHKITNGSKDIVIAIIDTGIDYRYPELNDSLWINENEIPNNNIDDDNNSKIDDIMGWNYIDRNNDPWDGYGHGTFISSQIIGLREKIGNYTINGLAPNISLMHLKWFSNSNIPGYRTDFIDAVQYAVNMGADIISLSLYWRAIPFDVIATLEWAYSKGVVIVGVTGNDADIYINRINDLGAIDQVIATGAVDRNFEKTNFSQYGNGIELVAPGNLIYGASVIGKGQNGSLFVNNSQFSIKNFDFSNSTTSPITGNLIYAGLGRINDFVNISTTGKIVLIDRGEISFTEKVENAYNNGALGVLIVNNQTGLISGVPTLDYPSSLPVLGITREDGEIFNNTFQSNQSLVATMKIWPELAIDSGTSFAVPYITSTAALLLSENSQLTNQEIRTLISRTATDINSSGWDKFTGFGLVNVSFALEVSADKLAPSVSIFTNYNNITEQMVITIAGSDNTNIYSLKVNIIFSNSVMELHEFNYHGHYLNQVIEEFLIDLAPNDLIKIQIFIEDIIGNQLTIEKNINIDSDPSGSTDSVNTSFTIFLALPVVMMVMTGFRRRTN
jgi:subtilisin family serine protease